MAVRLQIGPDNALILPDEAMRQLDIAPGDEVDVASENGAVVVRKAEDAVARARRLLLADRKPLSDEELDEAIDEARIAQSRWAEVHDDRTKRG